MLVIMPFTADESEEDSALPLLTRRPVERAIHSINEDYFHCPPDTADAAAPAATCAASTQEQASIMHPHFYLQLQDTSR